MASLLRIACLILFGALALAPAAQAQSPVLRAPPPRWVHELAIPAPRAARLRQVEDGVYYLLLDSQVKSGTGNDVFYTRSAYQVTDRSGLEDAARFEIDYDPSQEYVVLHHIRVIRHGVAMDRMADADVQVLRREEGLDKGVFDGHKTVHVEIKNVEVGDIVDYAYSWVSTASFWPGQYFGHVTTTWSVPLELMHYSLIWPADRRPITIHDRNTTLAPTVTVSGGDRIYDWRATDPDPVPTEDGTPQWYPAWGTVTLSSMASWSEVVAWALPMYTGKDALPPELAARADAIMRAHPRPEDRITLAMRLVEDELRYVSMSIGAGSYLPRSPTEVFRSGFGDCKDKSQLLVALLRHMGIAAYVALTDMDEGPSLADTAPSASVFDHAIVEVRLKGKSYWLDPTGSNEGGRFPHLAALNYGWALPIAPGQSRLERIPRPAAPAPDYRTVERYAFGDDAHPGMTLTVTTTYVDDEADSMRSDIATKSAAQLESDYLKFYAGMYPGLVRAGPMRIADDRDRNRIVISESYRLAAADLRHGKLLKKFEVKASSLDAYDKVPSGDRATPYGLTFPVNREHVIVLVTPGKAPPAPKPVAVDDAGFRYRMDVARDGDALTLDYHMVGRTDVLPAKEVDDVAGDADTVSDDNYWYLDLTSTAGGFIGEHDAGTTDWLQFVIDALALVGLASLLVMAGYGLRRGIDAMRRRAQRGLTIPG